MERTADRLANEQPGGRPTTLSPATLQALLGEAFRCQQSGRPVEAELLCQQVLAIDPQHADSLHLLGLFALQARCHAAAIDLIGQAIALRNDVPAYYNNLGSALQGCGRVADAVAQYEHALALKPDYARAHNNLGNALLAEGKPNEAIAQFRHALAIEPDYPEAHSNLGLGLQDLGRIDEAIEYYERALALNPNYARVHNNLGNALHAQGRFADAVAHYERAVTLKPDYAQAHHNLGVVLQDLGRLAQAQQAYENAIEIAPETTRYYRPLLDVRRVVAGDRYLATMETLALDMASLPVDEQKELHFVLGKAYADLEQHERSFRHLVAGNALKRRDIDYDEAATLGFFDRIRTVFTPELMWGRDGGGDPSTVPIFIVGMPRSGTTLVEQILASHPAVFGAGEREDFGRVVGGLHALNDAVPAFPEIVAGLSDEALRRVGAGYVAAIAAAAPDALRITDKMPGNAAYVGLIHLALPNARIIHVRRDPIDTCVSCFSIMFAVGQPQSYDLAELGRYYRAHATLMEHWHRVLPPGVMLDVQYEDVVSDTEQQARGMIAHCGLEWDAVCLDFHATQRPVRTASAAQVRQPIYRRSVGRWRAYGDLLGPLIKELGLAG